MSVGPVGSSGYNTNPPDEKWGVGEMPPGKPLDPNDPWCKALKTLFPHLSETEIQEYASRFRDNMMQAIQNQIKHDAQQAKKAADQLKKVAQGEE